MLDAELYFLGGGEDELIQVIEDKLERLRTCFVDLDDLGNDGCVKRLILYFAKE